MVCPTPACSDAALAGRWWRCLAGWSVAVVTWPDASSSWPAPVCLGRARCRPLGSDSIGRSA